MTHDAPDDPGIAEEILGRIADSPHAALLHDEGELRTGLARLMADHPDPTLAEMGRALESGEIDWRGLAAVPAYREVLVRGLTSLAAIDLADVAAGLDHARRGGWVSADRPAPA
jgi:hypothetical protein